MQRQASVLIHKLVIRSCRKKHIYNGITQKACERADDEHISLATRRKQKHGANAHQAHEAPFWGTVGEDAGSDTRFGLTCTDASPSAGESSPHLDSGVSAGRPGRSKVPTSEPSIDPWEVGHSDADVSALIYTNPEGDKSRGDKRQLPDSPE